MMQNIQTVVGWQRHGPISESGLSSFLRFHQRSPSSLMILHHARRDRGRRARDAHASAWINDGNGVSGANGGWLVELHLIDIIVVGGKVCVAVGV
jgi:hypothetical protein